MKMKIKDIKCEYAKRWALENNKDTKLKQPYEYHFNKGLEATLIFAFSFSKSAEGNDFWGYVDDHNPTTKELKEKFPEIYIIPIETSDFPFKVGDRVTVNDWLDYEFLDIKFIDFQKEIVFGYDQNGTPVYFKYKNHDWKLYQEEKPKDLADVFEYYTVSFKDGIKVSKCYGDKKHFEEHRFKNKHRDIEVITKEEVIERGLKVD